VVRDEAVEPVAVQRVERPPAAGPAERLEDLDAQQPARDRRQVAVVVARHPDDLGLARGAQPPHVEQQPPGVRAEVAVAEVVEDVAQQDQPVEPPGLQQPEQVARPADRQAEVEVGDDERVGLAGAGGDRRGLAHRRSPPSLAAQVRGRGARVRPAAQPIARVGDSLGGAA
jgi:hypothetical protein